MMLPIELVQKALNALGYLEKRKQPRIPAGSSTGGQFAGSGSVSENSHEERMSKLRAELDSLNNKLGNLKRQRRAGLGKYFSGGIKE
jgi:hypothetical protein